jgi:hypothetical protein
MKILNPTSHGALDYALAIAFLVLPGWLEFTQPAASMSYVVGVAYLAASLVTRYPLGLLKVLPFSMHGVLEAAMAVVWLAAPWLFGFAADVPARTVFVCAGVALLLAVSLTRYGEREAQRSPNRRGQMTDRREQSLPVARNRRLAVVDRRLAA